MKFSEKIIQARKAKALTQEDLAEAVGVSRQAVSKWETEEAKPDLEKLVAICKVLDLSMDYLCLDKMPTAAAQADGEREPIRPSVKRYLWIGVCIGLVAAILVGMLAMFLIGGESGIMQSQNQQTETVTTVPATTTAPDYSHMLGGLEVANASCESIGRRTWRITFVPSMQVPGMQVQIGVLDKQLGAIFYYKDATKIGTSYVIDYKVPDRAYDFDIIAVCSVGEISVQFSLVNLESSDGIGMHWEPIWNE